jgi:prophage regulatory protein
MKPRIPQVHINHVQNQLEEPQLDYFIRINEVMARTGVCRATIYNWIKDGSFPKQIQLGNSRIVAWSAQDIQKWQEDQKGGAK